MVGRETDRQRQTDSQTDRQTETETERVSFLAILKSKNIIAIYWGGE